MNNGNLICQLNPKVEEIFIKVPNYFHFLEENVFPLILDPELKSSPSRERLSITLS